MFRVKIWKYELSTDWLTDWLTDLLTSMPEMLRHLKICFWWVGQYLESNVLCLTVLKSWVHSLHQDCHQHHHPSCPHFHRYHDHHHSVKKLVVFSWKLVARVACWGEQQGGRHVFWQLAADPHVSPPPPSLCSCKYSHCNDDDQLSAQPTLNRESFQIETPNGDICWLKKARNCDKTKFAMSHFLAFFSYRT